MDREIICRIREQLKDSLSDKRYNHTVGVAYCAACLAMRYGADIDKAELAGLLHDCAKEYPSDELGAMCTEPWTEKTLHAVGAPIIAGKKYGITDPDILSSIRWHTTGKIDMTQLEKILYVADYIETNRENKPKLSEVREIAFMDLTYAVYLIAEIKIEFVKARNLPLDNNTIDCYEWLKENGIHDRQ